MQNMNLCVATDDWSGYPEGDDCWKTCVEYDPNNLKSIRKAQEAVKDNLNLAFVPILCNEPKPNRFKTALKTMQHWYGR
jgi:hypothetical protein